MQLVYIDESGDPGARNSPTRSYVLAGLCVQERYWASCHGALLNVRVRLEQVMGLGRSTEIHASEFLGGAKMYRGMEPWERIRAARWVIQDLSSLTTVRSVRAIRNKSTCVDPLGECWRELCAKASAHRPEAEEGVLLVTDMTDGKKVIQALGEMDRHLRARIIDNPFHRDSRESLLLQTVDLIAYLTRQQLEPNALFRTGLANGLMSDFRKWLCIAEAKREEPGQGPGS